MTSNTEIKPVKWVVDTYMTDVNPICSGFPTLAEAAKEAGYFIQTLRYKPGSDLYALRLGSHTCVVAYGTHQFIKEFTTYGTYSRWEPESFSVYDRLTYASFSQHLGDLMLNDDFVLLPFSEIVRRRPAAWGGRIFLKPNSVLKEFAGCVVDEGGFNDKVESIRAQNDFREDLLCVVAQPKVFEGEYRFVIADRKVVTGCQYMWNGQLDVRTDVPEVCSALAWEVAQRPWQADMVYVCDVAWTDERQRARLIELNSFSSSGLYACDTRKIVSAVSAAAWNMYSSDC